MEANMVATLDATKGHDSKPNEVESVTIDSSEDALEEINQKLDAIIEALGVES